MRVANEWIKNFDAILLTSKSPSDFGGDK
jgi:hypothetical protein